jgi:pimeloyl-ACP methyl ester carboxylesterase
LEIKSGADFIAVTRAAIAAAGFVRKKVGETVYWLSSSPPVSSPLPAAASPQWGEGGQRPGEGRTREHDTIVMIHGASDHSGTWFAVAPALARTRRVILPDLAGHGESAPKDGPIPISLIVERLEAVIDDAVGETEPVTLVGNSLGGWMALLYALKHPSRVSHLVLEDSGGLNRPLAVPLVARTREEALPILRAVHGPNYQEPEWVVEALLQRANGSPMLRLTELVENDVEPRLGTIDTPATLIWGADDGVLPMSYADALQQAIPGAKLQVIEGAAHVPHLQQPERFLQCLTSIS